MDYRNNQAQKMEMAKPTRQQGMGMMGMLPFPHHPPPGLRHIDAPPGLAHREAPPGLVPLSAPTAAASFDGKGNVNCLPKTMLPDQFGIAGLMVGRQAILGGEIPDRVSNEVMDEMEREFMKKRMTGDSEPFYKSFTGPIGKQSEPTFFSNCPENPCFSYHVTNRKFTENSEVDAEAIRKTLALKPNIFGEDLLFFLFYNFPRDILQLVAAEKLYLNGWRFHVEAKLWLHRLENFNYAAETDCSGVPLERGIYKYFNWQNWKVEQVECLLDYRKLEGRPNPPKEAFFNDINSPEPNHSPS